MFLQSTLDRYSDELSAEERAPFDAVIQTLTIQQLQLSEAERLKAAIPVEKGNALGVVDETELETALTLAKLGGHIQRIRNRMAVITPVGELMVMLSRTSGGK